jgi:transposase InsO family protein
MTFYNHDHPHSLLGGTPPAVFYRRIINAIQPDQQVQKVA